MITGTAKSEQPHFWSHTRITNAGILYHPKVQAAQSLAREIQRAMSSWNTEAWICSAWDEERARPLCNDAGVLVTIGGDGTILRAARIAAPASVPILPINMGRRGFIAELEPGDALEKLPALLAGEGWMDERAMLQAEVSQTSNPGASPPQDVLNEVVVGRAAITRVVRVKTTIDGTPFLTYVGDGVIVATATGSTGYSLSVGGPVLYPAAQEMVLTPIAPHLAFSRPLLLPASSVVELELEADHPAVVSIDGLLDYPIGTGDRVKIQHSPNVTRFLRTQSVEYFYRKLAESFKQISGG